MGKAFYLDRDGVINHDFGYVGSKARFEFIDGVFEACRLIMNQGFQIVIVTNQAGIARGYYDEEQFNKLNDWMLMQFKLHNIVITEVYHCPHHPDGIVEQYRQDCECRKPKPGMILKAANKHHINLSESVMVGDKNSDLEAGRRAGIGTLVGIESRYELDLAPGVVSYKSLLEAVETHFTTHTLNVE